MLVAKLAEELSNCEALEDGFAYMRENGTAIDNPEILEGDARGRHRVRGGLRAGGSRGAELPHPDGLSTAKVDGRWRISMTRYRTDREEGPAKCFVSGSFNDLC